MLVGYMRVSTDLTTLPGVIIQRRAEGVAPYDNPT